MTERQEQEGARERALEQIAVLKADLLNEKISVEQFLQRLEEIDQSQDNHQWQLAEELLALYQDEAVQEKCRDVSDAVELDRKLLEWALEMHVARGAHFVEKNIAKAKQHYETARDISLDLLKSGDVGAEADVYYAEGCIAAVEGDSERLKQMIKKLDEGENRSQLEALLKKLES